MKGLLLRATTYVVKTATRYFINYISDTGSKYKGFNLYRKIITIFIFPVFFSVVVLYEIREIFAKLIKKYILFKYYDFFTQYNISILKCMRYSYYFVDFIMLMMLLVYVTWYRTSKDHIWMAISNEMQSELVKTCNERVLDKKLVIYWLSVVQQIVYVLDADFKIIYLSDYFHKWFVMNGIKTSLKGKSIFETELCRDIDAKHRTLFSFERGSQTSVEDIEFNEKKFRFKIVRHKVMNGEPFVIVIMTQIKEGNNYVVS